MVNSSKNHSYTSFLTQKLFKYFYFIYSSVLLGSQNEVRWRRNRKSKCSVSNISIFKLIVIVQLGCLCV